MAYITWDETYSVKIDEIDEQHKKLIEMLNDFYSNLQTNSVKEKMLDLISSMKDYALIHFQTEERLLQQKGFYDMENHKTKHNEFVKKVNDWEDKLATDKMVLTLEVTNFLKNWLQNHILVEDMKYANAFNPN